MLLREKVFIGACQRERERLAAIKTSSWFPENSGKKAYFTVAIHACEET